MDFPVVPCNLFGDPLEAPKSCKLFALYLYNHNVKNHIHVTCITFNYYAHYTGTCQGVWPIRQQVNSEFSKFTKEKWESIKI